MSQPKVGPARSFSPFARLFLLILFVGTSSSHAQVITNDPPFYGPFNAVFLPDGDGLKKIVVEHDSVLRADSPWTLSCWIKISEAIKGPTLMAGLGDPADEYSRYLALDGQKLVLWMGKDNQLSGPASLAPGKWHFIAATFDGAEFQLFSDGVQIASGKLLLGSVSPVIHLAPPEPPWPEGEHFGGHIAGFTILRRALNEEEIRKDFQNPPDYATIVFEEGSKSWPVQTRGQAGYRAPQDPSTMPVSKAPYSAPVVHPLPILKTPLQENSENQWTIAGNWTLRPAPEVHADAAKISGRDFSTNDWWPATVPGTVLTTMIDRGVYPDPSYGLNNLAIPESLNKQDYWYRDEFTAPRSLAGRHLTLTFQGINYKAAVWLNGEFLGKITGAFIRGVFDVTNILKPGQTNVLAVRVSPPPHPGIPQEQSIKGGPGENGGIMCLDGPTFVATEGWDWIPAVRDRDTGIWQPVTIEATRSVSVGDPQVVTTLPLPDINRADVNITVPLQNVTNEAVRGVLSASFEGVKISKEVTIPPGETFVKLAPSEFAQLTVEHPRLWWPNGYGDPNLYHLKLTFEESGKESDEKRLTFGIREITYELSLLDDSGHLRRVEYSPATASTQHQLVVDVTHEGMREIPPADPFPATFPAAWREWWKSWVASLYPGAETSPSIRVLDDTKAAPYLVIKVNGVRIAARGGNWGMDDFLKRVSRQRLEPYFRLHRDAHLNIIRNWVGQSTEEVFYDLADEYGLLVWNDFWDSTQNYNVEAEDPALFLANARDTILRFRNHPSIVIWCGRNEGVPQPIINEGLIHLINSLDGTRYYSPSSNQVNLQNSGPYKFMDPKLYYTTLNHGFSVETGTPSFSTLESFSASIPKADRWPVSDDWAYHDWHQSGNGDVAPFMKAIEDEFGAATSLADFSRKAQMLNYVEHRAIFEGMNAHLWAPNSGRMLWMTQPAWPSNNWQIFSHDYDTPASYYGVKKACEPIHVQLDVSNGEVAVINTTDSSLSGLTVTADVYSIGNKLLFHHEEEKDASADAETNAFKLDLAPHLTAGIVFVKLQLHDSSGKLLSDNFYWLGQDDASYRELNHLPQIALATSATTQMDGTMLHLHVQLHNAAAAAALEAKLTLLYASDRSRILPVYYSDNYVSLLPGESRTIEIEYSASAARGAPQLALRGWNISPQTIQIRAN
ncbi:MAG TPA: LamG-like jellyroll fold domain-containing protein [Candidatus Acidoferrum sp.]|nr:LamG-like jellyroll fold domain-containing protein [Candidatus Acidoferrum sp.]